jgi:hypothetical protein
VEGEEGEASLLNGELHQKQNVVDGEGEMESCGVGAGQKARLHQRRDFMRTFFWE